MERTLNADQPGFISLVVLAEIVWVLVSLYALERTQVTEVIFSLLTAEQIRVESAELVWNAKRRYETSRSDFSDALIMERALAAGCQRTVTFDRAAAITAGFELLN